MNFGTCEAESGAAAPMARPTETFIGLEQPDGWLHQAAAKFRAAITLQIPVGYQDATGFHFVQESGQSRRDFTKPF